MKLRKHAHDGFLMTMKLKLTPEVQAGLMIQARASGLSSEKFAEQVLQEKSRLNGSSTERSVGGDCCAPLGNFRQAP